ncbi:hypothetical protein [Streptomyces sp. BE20]|uniref:hypothetical protein n=1 Tax=Streptomyces sp. BE20 TaxID=3002525 RepID=UPI003FA78C0A
MGCCRLRVAADEGVTGWGDPVVEGRVDTVRAAVHELAHHLVDEDPLRSSTAPRLARPGCRHSRVRNEFAYPRDRRVRPTSLTGRHRDGAGTPPRRQVTTCPPPAV